MVAHARPWRTCRGVQRGSKRRGRGRGRGNRQRTCLTCRRLPPPWRTGMAPGLPGTARGGRDCMSRPRWGGRAPVALQRTRALSVGTHGPSTTPARTALATALCGRMLPCLALPPNPCTSSCRWTPTTPAPSRPRPQGLGLGPAPTRQVVSGAQRRGPAGPHLRKCPGARHHPVGSPGPHPPEVPGPKSLPRRRQRPNPHPVPWGPPGPLCRHRPRTCHPAPGKFPGQTLGPAPPAPRKGACSRHRRTKPAPRPHGPPCHGHPRAPRPSVGSVL